MIFFFFAVCDYYLHLRKGGGCCLGEENDPVVEFDPKNKTDHQQKYKYNKDCTYDIFFCCMRLLLTLMKGWGALFGGRKRPGRRIRPKKQNRSHQFFFVAIIGEEHTAAAIMTHSLLYIQYFL